MIHPLCSGATCHAQAAEIAHLRQQLATAQGERDTARAQLVQAQAAAQEWRKARNFIIYATASSTNELFSLTALLFVSLHKQLDGCNYFPVDAAVFSLGNLAQLVVNVTRESNHMLNSLFAHMPYSFDTNLTLH